MCTVLFWWGKNLERESKTGTEIKLLTLSKSNVYCCCFVALIASYIKMRFIWKKRNTDAINCHKSDDAMFEQDLACYGIRTTLPECQSFIECLDTKY